MVRVHPEQRKLRPWLIVGALLALAVATSTLAIHGGAARSRLPTAIHVGPNATAGDGCRYESQLQGLLDVSTQTLQLVQAASGSLRQVGSAGLDADRLPAGASGQQWADVLQRELEAARRHSQELEWQLEEARAKGGSGGGGTVRLGAPTVRGTIPRKLHHMYLGDDGWVARGAVVHKRALHCTCAVNAHALPPAGLLAVAALFMLLPHTALKQWEGGAEMTNSALPRTAPQPA